MQIILIDVTYCIMPADRQRPDQPSPAAPPASAPRTISSEALFAPGQREVLILHGGEQYRLRQTRNGKLILTK